MQTQELTTLQGRVQYVIKQYGTIELLSLTVNRSGWWMKSQNLFGVALHGCVHAII